MRLRPMGMRVRFPLPVTVAMAVRVFVTMAVFVTVGLCCSMTTEVVMIMPMRWRRNCRLRNPALSPHLSRFRCLVIVFVPSPLRMSNESFQRWLIHMTRERNLGITHTQRSRIARLLCYGWRFTFVVPIAARSNSKRRDRARRSSPAFWTGFLLQCLAQRREHLEGEIAR
jgi:hypothetical protein